MQVEFCGEWFDVDPEEPFVVGREGDLAIDDNPYLHRRFLAITRSSDLWWLENVGTLIPATVADAQGNVQAWIAPGARLPLVFARTTVLFTAGPTTYELLIVGEEPAYEPVAQEVEQGDTTIGPVVLTDSQRALVVAFAEPVLRGRGSTTAIPSSTQAAARRAEEARSRLLVEELERLSADRGLGWTLADDFKAEAREGLQWLDAQLGARRFICGERLSLADLQLVSFLEFGALVGQGLDTRRCPNLARWLETMRSRPSVMTVR